MMGFKSGASKPNKLQHKCIPDGLIKRETVNHTKDQIGLIILYYTEMYDASL